MLFDNHAMSTPHPPPSMLPKVSEKLYMEMDFAFKHGSIAKTKIEQHYTKTATWGKLKVNIQSSPNENLFLFNKFKF